MTPKPQEANINRIQSRLVMIVVYRRGLQIATYRSNAITVSKARPVTPVERKKYICIKHPVLEMVLTSVSNTDSILGMVTDVYTISEKDKL